MAKKASDGTAAPKAPRTTGRGGPHTVGTNIIRMCRDAEGAPYGAKRNPKRGKSATRFALYKDGLTVNKAVELGLTKADIAYDVAHNFITLETPGA